MRSWKNTPEAASKPLYLPIDVRGFTESREEAVAGAKGMQGADEGYTTVLVFGIRALPNHVLELVPDDE